MLTLRLPPQPLLPPSARPPRRGFTLIEIMIVIAIIVILATIVVAIGVGVTSGAKERSTKATFKVLDSAMAAFLKSNLEPPADPTTGVASNWLQALQSFPPSADALKNLKLSSVGILDAYNNPILYIPSNTSVVKGLPGWTAKPQGFFWSYGSDGAPGGPHALFSDGTSAAP